MYDSNNVLETVVTRFPNGFSVTEICPDECSTYEVNEYGPKLCIFDSRMELWRKLDEEFPEGFDTNSMLVNGLDVEGAWYYWVSKYEHGGVAFALIGSLRSSQWPDQEWDVVPFVGWIKVTKKLRDEWGIGDDKERAMSAAAAELQEYEYYCNGEVYCVDTTWYRYVEEPVYGDLEVAYVDPEADDDDDRACRMVEEDSCCGFVGWDYAKQEASERGSWLPDSMK